MYPFKIQIMKSLITSIVFTLLITVSASKSANAQRLFDGIPEQMNFDNKIIEGLFNMNAGSAINVKFSQNFHLTGMIKSNDKVYANLQTVVIECTNYNKVKLFISKRINDDKSIKYVGRIIGRTAEDGFEIKGEPLAGNSSLTKINLKEMIVE